MKAIFKLFPVALVAIALASCSNDDFIKEGEYTPSKNSIALYIDNGAVTRTGVQETAEGNHFAWTKGDVIKLYGVNQVKTNKYVVKSTPEFVQGTASYDKAGIATYADLEGEDVIGTELAYAMYPGTDENFFNSEYFRQFEMQLPAEWTYQILGTDKNVFYADFPMWGVATDNNTKVSFKYTTSFLRLDLSGLSASATAKIIITADKQLNGRFTADLYDGAGDPVELPALKPADKLVDVNVSEIIDGATLAGVYNAATGLYDNIAALTDAQKRGFALQQVTVNLNNLSNNDSRIIYLPIPVQNYGKLNIVLYYPEENRTDVIFDKPLDLTTDTRGIGWFGNMKREFSVTDQFYFPSDINQELFDNREKTATLNYKSDVVMAVEAYDASNPGKSTILMPAMATPEVYLNFIKEGETAISGTGNTLYIKDRDASAPFTKRLVINTKSIKVGKLEINLPQADVVLIGGDDTNGLFGQITVKAAKSLTFGDNNVVTKQAASTQVDVDEEAVSPITVLGKAAINKIIFDNASASLTVGAVKDAATNEYYDDASVTTVTFNKNNPSVTVQGKGSISFLNSSFSGSDAVKAVGSVTTSGAAYIKNVTKDQNFSFTSTWDGVSKAAAAAVVDNKVFTAAQLAKYQGDATADVTINLMTDVDLQNKYWAGINAGTNAFTLIGTNTHKSNTTGDASTAAVHTISNLNLSGDATSGLAKIIADNAADYTVAATSGIGFVKAATTVTVTNLTITNASCALGKYNETSTTSNKKFQASNIGALAGYATGAIITGLTVTLAGDNFGYTVDNKATNIGGVIGNLAQAATATTITKASVTATGKIRGYYNLGGFIGGVTATAANVTINGTGDNACSATLGGFTVDYNNGKTIDKNIGRVGGFIGSAGTLAANGVYYDGTLNNAITLVGTATVTSWPDLTRNKIIQGTAPDFDYLTYQKKNDHIGYCGDVTTAGKITIGTTARTTPLTKPAAAADQNKALYWFE